MNRQVQADEVPVRKRRKKPVSAPGSRPPKPQISKIDSKSCGRYPMQPVLVRSGMLTFDSGRPFWMKIPKVLWVSVRVCLMPFVLLKSVVETALSVVMLSIFVGLGAWATGMVTNPQAADFLTSLGDRALELSRLLGLPY